jgi:hypothetical protein
VRPVSRATSSKHAATPARGGGKVAGREHLFAEDADEVRVGRHQRVEAEVVPARNIYT